MRGKEVPGMKKAAMVFVSAVLMLAVLLSFSGAFAATVYFAVVNENVMDLVPAYMPIRYNKVMYVPYTLFGEPNLKVYYSYNPNDYSVTFFNADEVLTFNINTGIAFDQEKQYKQRAVLINGMVYVPAQFMCERFGWKYSYLSTGPSVRIRTSVSRVSDSLFAHIAQDHMASMLSAYNLTPTAGTAQPTGATVSPTPTAHIRKEAYLTFDGGPDGSTSRILDILDEYDVKAAFFLEGKLLKDGGDVLRRLNGSGHTVGLLYTPPESRTGNDLTALEEDNGMLDRLLFMHTRFVRFTEGSGSFSEDDGIFDELVNSGYRCWDWNVAPDKNQGLGPTQIAARAVSSLKKIGSAAVIRLKTDAAGADALPMILRYLKEEDYIIRSISENTMPINERNDVR